MKCIPDIYPGLCNITLKIAKLYWKLIFQPPIWYRRRVSPICSTYAIVANIWAICGV